MSDEPDDEINNLEYLEHKTLFEGAAEGQPIEGSRVYAHPWNVPLPARPQPPAPPRYRLTVHHNSVKYADSDEPITLRAECDHMDQLLDLNDQLNRLDYHFVELSLIAPA